MENICYLNSNDGTGILTFGVETEIKATGVNSIEKLKEVLKNNLVVIYIDAPAELRKARAVARDKNFNEKEWYRRAADEDKVFKNVEKEVDYFVKNDNLEVCLKQIENIYLWHEFK